MEDLLIRTERFILHYYAESRRLYPTYLMKDCAQF